MRAAHLSDLSAVLTETYSASTLAISTSMPWSRRSQDSILLSLLSRSAAKMAHQPSVWRLLPRKLPGGEGTKCQRLLTLCQIRKVGMRGDALDGGERRVDLERLGKDRGALGSEAVPADAADAGGASVSGC